MNPHEHEIHIRWRLWMELRARADELRALANNWVNADPQLRHYIWMLQQADCDETPSSPATPPKR